ncbi:TIGR03086 family metal-binding protein [Amycolatopsis sp. NBC_00345]|uniref:TIGR03086 family metal-binding protein n=1 Tax=Amycolatopsis sp. NBC_00345 TaxID=2975955 RepID=UPI002E2561E0
MPDHSALLHPAAAAFLSAAASVDDLAVPTPCSGYDARALLNHLLYWGPWLAAAGRREEYAPAVQEAEAGLVDDGWLAALRKQTGVLVEAFEPAAAWAGTVTFGSSEMPAAAVGDMVLGEFVLHGWDLARASGAAWTCPDDAAAAVLAAAVEMGPVARSMGVYGPEVPVDSAAPVLDRALGAAGRDPAWTP